MGLKQYIFIAIFAYIACFIFYLDFSNEDSRLYLNGIEFMRYYGYDGEEHVVVSSDGFETKIHRLGHGGPGRKVMVYVPGIHCTSEVSFALGPERDISYSLYDAGVDLWMVNYRGTSNSIPSANRTYTDDELTNFSFHEQSYDVAAAIDYIWEVTGRQKITVSGGSLGVSIVLIMIAEKPEYNQKIEKGIFFGPFGPFSVKTSILQSLVLDTLHANKAISDYLSTSFKYRHKIVHIICSHPLSPFPCWPFIDAYLGFYSHGLTNPESAVAFNIMFTGPFIGVYEHIYQMVAVKKYVKRDYGRAENLKKYGSKSNPLYNMTNIKIPTIIFDATADNFLTTEARKIMSDLIPNIRKIVSVPPPFKHGNFVSNGAFDKKFMSSVKEAVLVFEDV